MGESQGGERERCAGRAKKRSRATRLGATAADLGYGGGCRDLVAAGRRPAASGDRSSAAAPTGDAHINLNAEIGSTNGVEPDDRAGTAPPPVAGGEARRRPRRRPAASCGWSCGTRGTTHIPAGSTARIQDQPADLRQPRRTALPAGRRRLHRDAGRNRHRPLARARAAWRSSTAPTCPRTTSWN